MNKGSKMPILEEEETTVENGINLDAHHHLDSTPNDLQRPHHETGPHLKKKNGFIHHNQSATPPNNSVSL